MARNNGLTIVAIVAIPMSLACFHFANQNQFLAGENLRRWLWLLEPQIVSETGVLQLPRIGPMMVIGLTPRELRLLLSVQFSHRLAFNADIRIADVRK